MPYVDTPLVNGAVMSWADLITNFSDARDWLNGGVLLTDIQTETVEREHLVRPTLSQYGAESTFQRAYRSTYVGLTTPTPLRFVDWGPKIDRLTIMPELCKGQTAGSDGLARWVLPIGGLLYVPETMDITVVVQFDALVRAKSDAVPNPTYPDGAGGVGLTAGRFYVLVHTRATSEEDVRQARPMYPLFDVSSSNTDTVFLDPVKICTTFQLDAGYHDIALVYYRGDEAIADLVDQIDLTNVALFIEAI